MPSTRASIWIPEAPRLRDTLRCRVLSAFAAFLLSSSPDAGPHTGTLDRELIRRGLRAQWPTLRRCFEQPTASSGKLTVRFVIGPDGRVTAAEQAQATTFSPGAVACVLSGVRQLKFAAPVGGSVLVTYPFIVDATGF